jgi:FAD/FMN-containing dehydrogenase
VAQPRDDGEGAELYSTGVPLIARGNGRAYGDAALNESGVIDTGLLNRLLDFDPATGVLTCESGVLLADVIAVFLPRGWFPLITPGTRFVTIGGLVAADVHGKNHHRVGSFCDHLSWIDLMLPGGDVLRCSAHAHPDLFAATCGGMGLTGTILRAAFRLTPVETGFIQQDARHAANLDDAFEIFEANLDQPYSVAWIDGLATGTETGRSVVFTGKHLAAGEQPGGRSPRLDLEPPKPKRVPVDFPSAALSRGPVRLFNAIYRRSRRSGSSAIGVYDYFYPLDGLLDWNRIYGRNGFVQYQCVLPLDEARAGLSRLLEEIARSGEASFLSVLKRMGKPSFGYLSFPLEGYTLAMDFPATARNLSLLDRLDRIMLEHRGRLYLAKDARAAPETIAAGYPELERFRAVRRGYGLEGRCESHLSRRLEL